MATLKSKRELGVKTVVEISVEGGVYYSPNGIINHNCNECKETHLMPDGITPRVFKMSEVSSSYAVRGEHKPSLAGQHPHCVTGNMLLHTDSGLYTFKDLFEKRTVQNVVVDKRIVNKKFPANQFGIEIPGKTWLNRHQEGTKILPATFVYDTGVQDCLKITLSNGQSMEVSLGHEMWLDDDRNGKTIKASELRVGDKIPTISGKSGFGKDSFEDLAELMGSVMGDGSISNSVASFNFFGNDLPYGATLLQKLDKILKRDPTKLLVKEKNKKYNVSRARFNSKKLGIILEKEFAFSKKPKRIPKRLWTATEKTICSFLRGLYAADGHAEKNPSVVLAQNDFTFLQEIQVLISMFGIGSHIYKHGEEVTKTITYADGRSYETKRKACWRLIISGIDQCRWFYEQVGFGVPLKQSVLKNHIDTSSTAPSRFSWRTSRVESIEFIGPQQTYCLTEPMTNTITVNGIVTKNCRCTLTLLPKTYGFKNGRIAYIGKDHDELKKQRSES